MATRAEITTKYAKAYKMATKKTKGTVLDEVVAVAAGQRQDGTVGDLVELVRMHQPGVSRHLKVLRNVGLVEVRRDAQRRLYRLRPEPLMELDEWLEPYRLEWSNRLDSLESLLERTATPTRNIRSTKEKS